ncbi:response regulator transcription factor [Streptomyces marispadix]|uniref:Response regulator transcription factor n=1 Tax=Streptomyces marispadix TaxID=2922868 RepID=A0ABS9SXA3_9ACTN|nr:response regulator transcription factor [Streptomyces marispadix]MCH6160885.1 response regulator transcription factor [Streptomyces marispadix]
MIRTLLVDDQQLVRAGLRMLCTAADGIEVVGEAEDGRQAIALVEQLVPHVVLMDLRMPGVDGITATRRILGARPSVRVLVLTTFDDDEHLYPALEAGACGFLAKDAAPEELLDGIRSAAAGRSPFSPHVLRRLVRRAVLAEGRPDGQEHTADAAAVALTARERDVLESVVVGRSNAEIAERLHIGVTTVKTHIAGLMAKTGSRNRVQLAVRAHHLGLGGPGPCSPGT